MADSLRRFRWILVAGGSLLLLGLTVIGGWLGHRPGLIRLLPDSDGMPYSTAAGFVLAGLLLIAGATQPRPAAATPRGKAFLAALAILLILLGLGALVEWQTGIRLGLSPDPVVLRQWFADTNPYAGRMRPLAAASFIAIGAVALLLPRTGGARAFALAQSLTLVIVFVGFVGVLGHLAGFGTIFVWYSPVFAAGIGFLLCGLGLALLVRHPADRLPGWGGDDSDKISLVAGAIVVAAGLGGLLGGFAVLYPQAVGVLQDNLALSLKNRGDTLQNAIQQGWLDSYNFGNQPLRLAAMGELNRHPRDPQPRAQLQAVAERYGAFGFSGVIFQDGAGREVARAGAFVTDPELSIQIATPSPSELLWRQGYVLHAHVDMIENGQRVGRMQAERRLPVGDDVHDTAHFGPSLDFAVCAPVGGNMDCFPFRSAAGKVLHQLPPTLGGRPLPMSYALAGKTGIVQTTDYRGIQVIAAHKPLGGLGLGAVLKIDAAELYDPIAQRLGPLFAMLVVVAAGAVLLLRIQLVPLVRRTFREIEDRKKAEARLQESEARLAEITSTLGEGVYVVDEQGIVTFANPEAERLLGWPAAELVGKDGHDTFHFRKPDGTVVPSSQCPFHQAVGKGQTYRALDDWFLRKDGTFLPVSIIARPIIRQGQVKGSVASFEDISERKRIEELLRESEERFRLISATATDGIVTIGTAGEVVYWNPAAEKLFGYPASEAVGQDFHDLVAPPRYREDFRRGFERFRASGEGAIIGKIFEVAARRKSGEEFPVELSVSALHIKGEWQALGVIRDISERKRAEEEIRHLAYYDFLTDLPNRRLFLDRLNQALVQAKRYHRALAVLYLDLDRFKDINDSLGHDVGDGLLVAVATRLRGCIRESDTVSRLGGDEFAMVLAEIAQPQDAAVVAEKVLATLDEPMGVNGHELRVSTSIGIAIYPVDGGDDALALVKKADMALYEAKAAGRNRYTFSSSPVAD